MAKEVPSQAGRCLRTEQSRQRARSRKWDSPSSSTPSGGPSPSAAHSSAQNAEQPSTTAEAAQRFFSQAPPPLTDRGLEVLRLLAAGRSNQRIAGDLSWRSTRSKARDPGSDQVSVAAGRLWWIPGWPVARPSMNRRTPYPAG
jgi:hypothetical protein